MTRLAKRGLGRATTGPDTSWRSRCWLGLCALVFLGSVPMALAQEAILAEWVETDPFNERGLLALGYPPPIPVNTPLPFDGFRSYPGLHLRHQDLAATTPWVHPEVIGVTRAGRDIWAYRLGDEDRLTPWGTPEAATLTNGGIHAREWQTPETVTGILELLATRESDQHLYDYLREQVNMIVIPVLNIDGFLQTQRSPTQNYLGTDPDYPEQWPRDGRMRRKNMLATDENLSTRDDHLNGVDLNRNNPVYWNSTNGDRSSDNPRSLVHHGQEPQSEPEARALDAAAALGPVPQLRLYTDVHSYSMVHFWGRTDNDRLAEQTERVLDVFTDHHQAFPAGKWYAFADRDSVPRNQGIGTTDEYFTVNYQVPSWTLEIEPSNGQSFHEPLPGGGADYGGEGENGHDGFILPEAEIRRVREQLAQTFATVYYRQSGPPHIQSLQIIDKLTGATVYRANWDFADETHRVLRDRQLQPLVLGRKYQLWMAFNKPMRWLENGEVTLFPGQFSDTLGLNFDALIGAQPVDLIKNPVNVALQPGSAPDGYLRYRTDTFWTEFSFQSSANNRDRFANDEVVSLRIRTRDMLGLGLDTNPGTVAGWSDGHWSAYENSLGMEDDFGGSDTNYKLTVSNQAQPDPFTLEPGIAGAWFDPERDGEGFIIEMLADNKAVAYWFTYDDNGAQDWYIAQGQREGNRLEFDALLRVSGGEFGPDFDPDRVTREKVGSATFTWSACDEGDMEWHIGNRRGHQTLNRLTRLQGLDCREPAMGPPIRQEASFSGAWYDPSHSGEGYTLGILGDNSAVVYWFSFDPAGARRWFFGIGELTDGTFRIDSLNTTRGARFGGDFDKDDVVLERWGTLELELACEGGVARYQSDEAGFGEGRLDLVKLTNLEGVGCP